MKSGVSWWVGSYCPRLRMRSLRKWTYEQKGAFSQCPREIFQSLPCHIPTPWLSLCQPLLASVLWSQKDCHLALPRRLNGHVYLPIPGISMAQHRAGVSKSQRESFSALLLTPEVLVRVPRPECHCPAWVHCCPLPVYKPGTYSYSSSSKDLSSAKVPWSRIVILTHTC